MPEMSVDLEAIVDALAEEMSNHSEYGVRDVTDTEQDMRSGGYFFDFTGKDGHDYTLLVCERS